MTVKEWIKKQSPPIQEEVWKEIASILSNRELLQIMEGYCQGRSLMSLHEELGVFNRYQVEILRVLAALSHRFPDEVIP